MTWFGGEDDLSRPWPWWRSALGLVVLVGLYAAAVAYETVWERIPMSVQLAIELYAVASLCSLAAVVALFLKAYWPAPEVRTLARPQLNALLEAPLRADSSVRNVVPVTKQEVSEIDQMIDALLTLEPRPTPLARMKPASKRVM